MKIANHAVLCRRALSIFLILLSGGCGAEPQKPAPQDPSAKPPEPVATSRLPAVAGLFYPKDPKELSSLMDSQLAAAPARSITNLHALICPHAGYIFSGPTAATGYKTLAGHDYRTVIILAASHYADLRGVSVPASSFYETPLGRIPVSPMAGTLAKEKPFVMEPRCYVQRPAWATQTSRPAPPAGEDTPETWEHSVEVQLPFLQKVLTNFAILPVVFGDADPETVAAKLAGILDDRTLVIASTDLSHYHPYAEARAMDRQTVKDICDLNIAALSSATAEGAACGRQPVLTLMHLARMKELTPQLLDCRNSGDTAGDKDRVVGYTAIAFSGAPAGLPTSTTSNAAAITAPSPSIWTAEEKKFLLSLARKTLQQVTSGKGLPPVPEIIPARCQESRGCFVTLTRDGQLRGCIGNILPAGPLHLAVMENARSAALNDPRFRPVSADEAEKLHIEISVLTEPRPLAFNSPEDLLQKLQPGRDGVVLTIGFHKSTFLPQVWEQIPDKVEFLDQLALKGGSPASAWRGKDVSVSIYHVAAFEESR
jgi:AmmeMemoRadiSam system protein B/AmmeMemoRadiSam system protein A